MEAEPTGEAGGMERLRVLSYNIHSQRDDVAALTEVVRAIQPDVMIVQEAPRRFRWRYGCASLADRFGLVVAGGGLPALGNLLLTSLRVRVHRVRCVRFPLTPGRHMRGTAIAECSVGSGVRFAVAGSHLSTDPVERPGQAALLKLEFTAVGSPLILGVDLNETATGSAWRTVADGLTDAAVAAGLPDRYTYSCANPRQRIDAVFVDPRIIVVNYDVVDNGRTRRASDHFPVLVDLLLPGTG